MARSALCRLYADGGNAGFSAVATFRGCQMKKTPDSTKAESSAPSKRNFTATHPAQLHLHFYFDHDKPAVVPPAARFQKRRTTTSAAPATGSKISTILRLFLMGRNMNRFEAEDHHDHCLHSTVSTLQNGYGILIARITEIVPCLRGRKTVSVSRYWLDTAIDNIAAARALLSTLERRA